MNDEILSSIWRRRAAWSRAAGRIGRRIAYARGAALTLSSLGAVLAAVASTLLAQSPHWRSISAGVGAVLLAVATVITTRLLTISAVRNWVRMRSVSEAIKAEVYSFRAGVAPYDGPEAIKTLHRKVNEVEEPAADLEHYVADVSGEPNAPPPPLRPEDYIKLRIETQIEDYYRRKARLYARRLALLRGSEFALGLAATALSAAAAFFSANTRPTPTADASGIGQAAWVAVLTTLGGALAAHIAGTRYDFLVMSYYATARRLEDLVDGWRLDGSPSDLTRWSAFVRACEQAISVENESWLAKWTDRDAAK